MPSVDHPIHLVFDLLACLAAFGAGYWQRTRCALPRSPQIGQAYVAALVAGAAVGGYVFGTWNLLLSGQSILAHSVLGALAGAIVFVELYKWARGVEAPTGGSYALPFCFAVAVGRIGCFLSGLGDMTYGTPTGLPWGVDFGDGVLRHPVQIYESLCMTGMALGCIHWMKRDRQGYMRYSFPCVVLYYAGQRFMWEFLKPYRAVAGTFNLFHFLCLFLAVYSLVLIVRRRSLV